MPCAAGVRCRQLENAAHLQEFFHTAEILARVNNNKRGHVSHHRHHQHRHKPLPGPLRDFILPLPPMGSAPPFPQPQEKLPQPETEPSIDLDANTFVRKVDNITEMLQTLLNRPQCSHVPAPAAAASSLPRSNNNQHVHYGVVCDSCNERIFGIRYKCGHCVDFDLCEACEERLGSSSSVHDPRHVFIKIRTPLPSREGRHGWSYHKPLLHRVPLMMHEQTSATNAAAEPVPRPAATSAAPPVMIPVQQQQQQQQQQGPVQNLFAVGDRLEAIDRKYRSLLCKKK